MAGVPVVFNCLVYPRNKTVAPFPATIVGIASIEGIGPEHPIVIPPPPDIPVEPPLVIWPNPPEGQAPLPSHPIALPGDPWWPDEPPPDMPPDTVEPPHEGWNWSATKGQWYFLYVPGKDAAQPKKK